MEYTPFKLVGEFDHENEFVITTLQRFDDEYVKSRENASFFSMDTPEGGLVITPFKLKDRKYCNHTVFLFFLC